MRRGREARVRLFRGGNETRLRKKGADKMKIQILGTGCPKCKKLAEVAEETAKELGLDYEIE